MEWFHRLDDAGVDAKVDSGAGRTDGVAQRVRRGVAVGFDANSIDTQQRGASVFIGAGALFDGGEGPFAEKGSSHAQRGFAKLILDPRDHRFGKTLDGFEKNIPGESIADDNLDGFFKNAVPLDIANK
jgi:hypothetical protein